MSAPLYSRADYLDQFERAGFAAKASRVSLASGLKYYLDAMVNGLTHARYVFVATRKERTAQGRFRKLST